MKNSGTLSNFLSNNQLSKTGTTVVVPYTYPLDLVPGASFAYSLRKLSVGYAGAAVRIRRSSDNTEQDIGFVGYNFDAASFTAFVGAGTGFITKLYDQTGNGNHIIQATAANQPKLQLAIVNGYPSPIFVKANSNYLSFTPAAKPANWTTVSAYKINNLNVDSQWVCGATNGGANINMWGTIAGVDFPGNCLNGKIEALCGDGVSAYSGGNTNAVNITASGIYRVTTARFADGVNNIDIRNQGVSYPITSSGLGIHCAGTSYPYTLGKAYNTTTHLDGGILEHIVYTSYVSDSDVVKIEKSIRNFYGI